MKSYTWKCADGRVINHKDLGDKHLVNILILIERTLRLHGSSGGILNDDAIRIPQEQLEQYDRLVLEAVRRGLFDWSAERKYLSATSTLITKRAKQTTRTVRQLCTPPLRRPAGFRPMFTEPSRRGPSTLPSTAVLTCVDQSEHQTTFTLVDYHGR